MTAHGFFYNTGREFAKFGNAAAAVSPIDTASVLLTSPANAAGASTVAVSVESPPAAQQYFGQLAGFRYYTPPHGANKSLRNTLLTRGDSQ